MLILVGICIAHAALPSDEIRHVPAPEVIDLSRVDPSAPKAFAAQDGNLTMFSKRELPNIGHYCTWAVPIVQEDPVLTDSQQSVLGEVASNGTGANATTINSTSTGGMMYL